MAQRRNNQTTHSNPWMPAHYTNSQAASIQALARGDADSGQQQMALKWIVENLCGTYDMVYRPQGDRDTVFAAAKQFVGQQIVKATKLNLNALSKESDNARPKQ